jgi:hypothetical protein
VEEIAAACLTNDDRYVILERHRAGADNHVMLEYKIKRDLYMIRQKFAQTSALLILIGAVMIAAATSEARENRKKSPPASAPRSSGSRQSSGAGSRRAAPPSRPSISSRPAPRPSSRVPQITTRQSRKAAPGRETTSGIRLPGTISSSRTSRSGVNSAGPGISGGRISRKQNVAPSAQRSAVLSGSRVDRRASSYPGYPPTRRSLYHYHRHDYPSHRIFYWITWPNCCRRDM